jgi:hypothetical protein
VGRIEMKISAWFKRLAYCAMCAASFAVPAWAHHSTASFDYGKQITLAGTVMQFKWTNPHMYLDVLVPDENGQAKTWSVECGTPNLNVRHGWKKDVLMPGDKVTMVIHPNRDDTIPGGTLMRVTLPNGQVLQAPGGDIVAAEPGQLNSK